MVITITAILTSILDFKSENSIFKLKSLGTTHILRDSTILVKTFGTLCVSGEENVIQVDPPPPLNIRVLGVTSQTLFTYFAYGKDLNFVWGGGGKILFRPCL